MRLMCSLCSVLAMSANNLNHSVKPTSILPFMLQVLAKKSKFVLLHLRQMHVSLIKWFLTKHYIFEKLDKTWILLHYIAYIKVY